MNIKIENTVTAHIVLSQSDLNLLTAGEMILQLTEGQADEKPMYIAITKGDK